jgi:predicted dehydrogenase
MINIGIVGFGYWGPNLLRNFLLAENCNVVYVCDLDKKRLQSVTKMYSNIIVTDNFNDLLSDKNIQAIVIATPPESHFYLAKKALLAGKDVLVEKPLATSVKDAKELVSLAKKEKRIIMVDHTFVYSKAVEELKKIITSKKSGRIMNITSTRINLGLYQSNVNVVQDLAIHDFSILDYLFGVLPTAVLTIGKKHFDTEQEDQAYIHLWYPNDILVTVQVSWLSPIKVRQMVLCGTKQMIVYDELETSQKIKVYERGIKVERDPLKIQQMKVGYRQGDIYSPYVDITETLGLVAADFIESVITRKSPKSDGEAGVRIVQVLELALNSLKKNKKEIRKEKV